MKTSFLTCLLTLASCASLQAQLPKAPDSLRPSAAPQVPATPASQVEKMAEEAQKSLYEAAGSGGSTTAAPTGGNPYASSPGVTTSSGSMRLPSPTPNNPATWTKDSVHKLAVMEVELGGSTETVMIELFPSSAPQTVANFINLSQSGVYNGLAFHRAIEGFLVQTGDPLTADNSARERWGTGGEDKTIPAEISRRHRIGSVAMARRSDKVNPDRRSNGSQFYITLGNFAALDGKYTVFGEVVSGLSVIQSISQMPVDANDCPVARIEVKSVKIIDHKGPMQIAPEIAGQGQRYTKPNSARGVVGRFLHRVW